MNIIITGGHSGMGFELSKKLLSEGHQIGLIVRSEKRKAETQQLFSNNDNVKVFVADLSNRDEIASVAKEIQSNFSSLGGIFNNAGVLLDKLYFSEYGNELQLEINAISPYLLTKALLPLLEKSDNPFVVNTATAGLNNKKSIDISAFKKPQKFTKLTGSYMDSKLTLVVLMNHLSKHHKNIRFVCVNPGAIKTKMTAGDGMPFWLKPIRNLFFKSPEQGAQNLYDGSFSDTIKGSGIYVSAGKVKVMNVSISQDQVEELLK
jgi:NAD(P)-dependent dehydrogenase (short-subunit alcohol dehydrogenase family)